MTLNEMTAALNARTDEHGERMRFGTNYAGFFDISDEEAERIAARASSADEFIAIWENEDWWADENFA